MYLVHIHLRPPPGGGVLPGDTAGLVMSAGRGTGLEHAAVHSENGQDPVIGVYVRATTLPDAEAVASDIWKRTTRADPRLDRWTPLRIEVPLLPPPPEWPA